MKSPSRFIFAFRFRLQTMVVLLTTFAIGLGLVTRELHCERLKKLRAAEVRRLGGKVTYNVRQKNIQTGIVNGYLRVILGDAYFSEVREIAFTPRTASEIKWLRSFPELTSLGLGGDAVTEDSLAIVGSLPQLERLYLRDCSLDTLNQLKELPKLNTLRFSNCRLADAGLKSLSELSNLSSLEFEGCELSYEKLNSLKPIKKLSLSFLKCSFDNANLKTFYGMSSPIHLRLHDTEVNEAGVLAVRQANPVWSIHVSSGRDPHYVESKFPSLNEMPQVKELAFQGPFTTDLTLASLREAHGLVSLRFQNCLLTDEGMQSLGRLQNLTTLHIQGTSITDAGLRSLGNLPKLEFLLLREAKSQHLSLTGLPTQIKTLVTDAPEEALADIAKLPNLEKLCLINSRISKHGVDALAKFVSLRELILTRTTISDADRTQLQQALPDCEIFSE